MAFPAKDIKWVTTDCYGTLIDWEKGIIDAFEKEAERDGLLSTRATVLSASSRPRPEIMAGSYELYAEVLRRAAVKVAEEIGWELEPSRAQFLPDSVAQWQPFRESNAAMDRLAKKLRDRDHLQHRRQAARDLAPAPAHRPRPRRHRPAGPQLQARPGPLQGVRAADRRQEGLGPHRRRATTPTSRPCLKMNVPVIWVNRHGEKLEGRKAARRDGQELPRRRGEARRQVVSRRRPAAAPRGGRRAKLRRSPRGSPSSSTPPDELLAASPRGDEEVVVVGRHDDLADRAGGGRVPSSAG